MQTFYYAFYTKPKRGRKPKISLPQIATLFLMSYITNAPVLTLARLFISPSIKSYQIFRKTKIKQVYRFLRDFPLWKTTMIILLKTLSGKKLRLIVDGTILPVANVNRARSRVDGVLICDAKEDKALRQVVDGVIGAVKGLNFVSRWRKGITLLSYLCAYALGYSFFRRAYLWS